MNDKLNSAFMDDPEFQSLMVDCMEALQSGKSVDRDALRKKFPKYADDLDQYLDVLNVLDQFAGGRQQISGEPVSPYGATVTPHTGNSDVESGDTIRYIGEYEVLEEIARGGMGVVFKARQQTLKRTVALKMILSGRLADTAEVDRFKREAQAASRLQHPNIVPVHEIGEHDGRQYFTMDYVEGHSLGDEIREESLAPKRAARLAKAVAEAVHFAHEKGTLHRDLKPANVLLTSDDVPHVTDFGLAKFLDEIDEESRAKLTASGQILGTPSYMAPEQAAGKQNPVGPASDIYSLGAILYACLTGRAPFVADSPVDTLMQVIHKEPVPPRQLNPAVPQDLETICLKCLNKEPHNRYGTAQELADDLQRFLEGRPVLARPIGPVAKLWRWSKRNPWNAALLMLSTTLLVGGTVVSTNFAIEAEQRADAEAFQRGRADREAERYRKSMIETKRALRNEQQALGKASQERDLANLRLEKLSRALYAANLDEAYDLWKPNYLDALRRLTDEAICPQELRDFSWKYLRTLTDWTSTKWNLDAPPLNQMELKPDQFKVPLVSRTRVGVFQPDIGSPVAVIDVPVGESFDVVAYARDGRYVAASSGTIITIWETRSGRVIQEIEQESDVNCMEFTAAPRQLVTGGKGIIIWNIENGKMTQRLGDERHDITHLSVSADGTRILSATSSGLIELWDSTQENPLNTISENEEGVYQVTISLDSQHYMICSAASFRMCDLQSGEILWKLDQPFRVDQKWKFAVFSDDSRFVVTSGGRYHAPTFWDAKSGEKQIAHKAMRLSQDVQFTANGRRLISRNRRGWGYVQRIPPPEGSLPIDTPAYEERSAFGQQSALSPDGRQLAVAAGQDKLQIYELQTQRVIRTIDDVRARHLAWSPNGDLLAGLLEKGDVVVWEAGTGETLHHLQNPPTPGKGLVFINGDQTLAFPTGKQGMSLWNLSTGGTIEKSFGRYPVYSLAVSPDGRYLAAGTGFSPFNWASALRGGTRVAGKVYLWDLSTLQKAAELDGHEHHGIKDLAFSPDGQTLASASNNVILWDVETFQRRKTISWLSSHVHSVWSVDYSPDGQTIATASDDGSLRLWDPITGVQRLALIEAIPVFTGGGTLTSRVEFTSDGEWLVSTWLGYKIQLWPADSPDSDDETLGMR